MPLTAEAINLDYAQQVCDYLPSATYDQVRKVYKTVLSDPELDDCVLAAMGRADLFFLLTNILNRPDLYHPWLYERTREVEANPDGHLDLWAREHYKSTIITFGLTIQDILNNPEETVGIFSHIRPIAKGFLRQIKREMEANDVLKSLYSEIIWANPRKQAPKWSEDDGIVVKRTGNPPEATVEAWGLVDGMPTSKHFKKLIFDDVVTEKSVTTPDMMKKVTDAWALALRLGQKDGTRRLIGTRYHYADTYKTIMDRRAAIPRIHPATKDGKVEGEPVFLTREALAEMRRDMGPYIFGCQMLQDPKADEAQGFLEKWLRYWEPKAWQNFNRYILVDPAREKKKTSDYTSMFVIGLGQDQNDYVIDIVRDRLNLTERARHLIRLHREYKPISVGYEHYGMQADIEHIKYVQEQENYRFPIIELGGITSKVDRIRRLIPIFEQGRFYFPIRTMFIDHEKKAHDLTREFIEEEFLPFPVGVHDDMLDCASRILDPDMKAVFPQAKPVELPRAAKADYQP